MLPIVHRELVVASRSRMLYSGRLWWGALQTVAACAVLIISGGGFRPAAAEGFFQTFSRLALFLCLLEGVRKTSDAISSEKREGTLGILFLSTLSGLDVIFGKISGALIRSLSVLLPFLPILAISLLVGGTTLGEFWRVALLLLTTLLMSLSLCILVSVSSREQSVATAILALIFVCLTPVLIAWFLPELAEYVRPISPFAGLSAAEDLFYRKSPMPYWIGIAANLFTTVTTLALASIWVPRVWQETVIVRKRENGATRRSRDKAILERNPVVWLNSDEIGRRWFGVLGLLITAVGMIPVVVFSLQGAGGPAIAGIPGIAAGILLLMIWLRVAIQTATAMAEAKQDGTLTLLLSTPLSIEEVLKGYGMALFKSVKMPTICAFLLMLGSFMVVADGSFSQAVWTGKVTIELLLEIAVLGAVGMWMGLKAKTRAAAVVRTILIGGFLPWVFCVLPIALQVVLILSSVDKVKRILRQIRTGSDETPLPVWIPRRVVPGEVPPVIR